MNLKGFWEKEQRKSNLRARDKSIARDFQRLIREQEG